MDYLEITKTDIIEKYLSDEGTDSLDKEAIGLLIGKDQTGKVEEVLRKTWDSIPTFPLRKSDLLRLQLMKRSLFQRDVQSKKSRTKWTIVSLVSTSVAACILYLFLTYPQPEQSIEIVATAPPPVEVVVDTVAQPELPLPKQAVPIVYKERVVELVAAIDRNSFVGEILAPATVSTLAVAAPVMRVVEPIRLANRLVVSEGTVQRLVLIDGSQVNVYGGSILTMLSSPDSPERRMSLVGKADFEVQHDAERPFIVETESLSVHVHGTSFVVSSDPNERVDRIKLKKGSVEIVIGDGLRYRLNPGEVLTYDRETLGLSIQ